MSIDLHTLSGAYALDALSASEADEFATHLGQCPACREEVAELQEVAARMGASEAAAPTAALKARILAAADQQAQLPPKVTSIDRARPRRWVPRLVGVAAAMILAVTGGVALLNSQGPDSSTVAAGSVAQVFKAPDAKTQTVTTSNGGHLKVATSAAYGQLAIATADLPKLDHRSYQMWAVRNGRSTSVGVIDDLAAGKVMPIPSAGTVVAITVEPEGGSKQPTRQPIIEMDPQSV